jgi:hypothetical protein
MNSLNRVPLRVNTCVQARQRRLIDDVLRKSQLSDCFLVSIFLGVSLSGGITPIGRLEGDTRGRGSVHDQRQIHDGVKLDK